MRDGMNAKIIYVTAPFLYQLFTAMGIAPEGGRVIQTDYMSDRLAWGLVVVHPDFPLNKGGEIIPDAAPAIIDETRLPDMLEAYAAMLRERYAK